MTNPRSLPKNRLDSDCTIGDLKEKVAQFVRKRDWEQYHSPKNLSMSLAIEASELMELFQWVGSNDSKDVLKDQRREIQDELADIATYLLEFCNLYDIDLSTAVSRKLRLNARKYPVKLVKGKSHKYTEYGQNSNDV